jgi:hypothetical protein
VIGIVPGGGCDWGEETPVVPREGANSQLP